MTWQCREIEAELVGFIEGEIDPATARQVRAHLKLCSGCWRKAMGISRIVGLLLEGASEPPPAGLAERTYIRCAAELA